MVQNGCADETQLGRKYYDLVSVAIIIQGGRGGSERTAVSRDGDAQPGRMGHAAATATA
jgi:hypothetical protein